MMKTVLKGEKWISIGYCKSRIQNLHQHPKKGSIGKKAGEMGEQANKEHLKQAFQGIMFKMNPILMNFIMPFYDPSTLGIV